MSSRVKTCKRACYRGQKWLRRRWWRMTRQQSKVSLLKGREPDPPSHRHFEKWERE